MGLMMQTTACGSLKLVVCTSEAAVGCTGVLDGEGRGAVRTPTRRHTFFARCNDELDVSVSDVVEESKCA